jgi:hypothetical protein
VSASEWIALGQAFIALVTTVVAIVAAFIAKHAIEANRKTVKQQRTIELMLSNPESDRFEEAFHLLRSCTSTEQFGTKENKDTSEAKNIRKLLNYYENLAIGIEHDIYDARIIFDTKKSTILSVWTACQPFVLKMRKEYTNKDLYIAFERMVGFFANFEQKSNNNHLD